MHMEAEAGHAASAGLSWTPPSLESPSTRASTSGQATHSRRQAGALNLREQSFTSAITR